MAATFDPEKRYVRLVERRPDGFVEFEFSVGEPEVYAEMILREEDFKEFCEKQKVIMIDEQSNPIDHSNDFEHRLRDARLKN
jgi:phenol/toluene 2-monooxygenase (NADH) P0/A0